MFFIQKLSLTQFKNYDFSTFTFGERVVGICGLNGKGKTNLLDAVYYCCFTKSYFTKIDGQNVQFDKDGFRIEMDLLQNQDDENEANKTKADQIVCIFRVGGKKEITLNNVPYTRFSEHIGHFPAVMIAPDDIELVTGGSEVRRKFMDTLLSQTDHEYLLHLITYNKVLLQRNSLLKRIAEEGKTDWALLEILDEQLIAPGNYIFECRRRLTEQMIPLVQKFYLEIAGKAEIVSMDYESKLLLHSFHNLVNQYRQKDFLSQRTNAGIHKDELAFVLNGQVFKSTASQGQRKSLLFALKLAEFEVLKASKGFTPLLLLDDVFEKLDDERMEKLLQWVCHENKGQVFITDTHPERLKDVLERLKTAYQLLAL